MLRCCADIAARQGLPVHVGNLLSSDRFYNDEDDLPPAQRSTALWGKMGVLAVEMEAAALYMTAARLGRQALAICTVSDHIVTGESTTAAERQTSFTAMMQQVNSELSKVLSPGSAGCSGDCSGCGGHCRH